MKHTKAEEQIKETVRERYGDIARRFVEAPSQASCCGPSQTQATSCCGPSEPATCCGPSEAAVDVASTRTAKSLL